MIKIRSYQKSKVIIIGLGITGLSCVNFFLNRGVIPKITDTRINPPLMHKLPRFIQCCVGRLHDTWILCAQLIVISPGVRLDHPILVEAMQLGIEIIGDIELFVRETTTPIIAITGSNGKSTVTQLIGNMARCAGWRVGIAGNIGIPVLSLLDKQYQLYILELSSFQLDVTHSLCATAATILNISEDHMDRYPGGLKQYYLSKKKIYHNAIACIVNALDPLTAPITHNHGYQVSFSIYSDTADYRLEYYKGNIWIIAYNEYVLNCAQLKINNHIHYMNVLSALALSDSVNIPRFASIKALQHFSGLSHRLQLIHKNRDVSWINDSKATNVGATKEAVLSILVVLSGRLHLLLGGDGKLADFSSLKNLIKQYEIHLYCFGKDGALLTKLGFNKIFLTNTMTDAMYIISRRIQKKDIVLLSPACSSLDQFSSFASRGRVFTYFSEKFR